MKQKALFSCHDCEGLKTQIEKEVKETNPQEVNGLFKKQKN
jgi:hypothetical protein